MDLKINSAQPNFRARMQLRGNISLLKKEQAQSLKTIIEKIGAKTDIVDITLPEKLAKSGVVQMAGYINGELEQFVGKYKKSDIYSGIINGLDKVKEIFPTVALATGGAVAVNEVANTDNNQKVNEAKNTAPTIQPVSVIDALFKEITVNFLIQKFKTVKKEIEGLGYSYSDLKGLWPFVRAGVNSDAKLKEEYIERMQKRTYSVPYSFEPQHYTGDDAKDSSNRDWELDSSCEIRWMVTSNPEKKAQIINATCSTIAKIYLTKRGLMIKEIIQQYKDDMFIQERIDEFEDFYTDLEKSKKKNVKFDRHAKTVQSLYSYLEEENGRAISWELDNLKQDSFINSDNDRYAKAISKYFERFPNSVKKDVQKWIEYELKNRTTAEERLNQKIDALALLFDRKLNDISKRILTEGDIKNIIAHETNNLRSKVKFLDKNVNMFNERVFLSAPVDSDLLVDGRDIEWAANVALYSRDYDG